MSSAMPRSVGIGPSKSRGTISTSRQARVLPLAARFEACFCFAWAARASGSVVGISKASACRTTATRRGRTQTAGPPRPRACPGPEPRPGRSPTSSACRGTRIGSLPLARGSGKNPPRPPPPPPVAKLGERRHRSRPRVRGVSGECRAGYRVRGDTHRAASPCYNNLDHTSEIIDIA